MIFSYHKLCNPWERSAPQSFFNNVKSDSCQSSSRPFYIFEVVRHFVRRFSLPIPITGVGTGLSGPPTWKKGGPAPYFAPPHFSWSTSLCLSSLYQFISCNTLGSTALALICVIGHFRVLENEKFSTPLEGEPLPHPPQLGRSTPSYVWPPTFKYVATPIADHLILKMSTYILFKDHIILF